jgi:hypothetical protein
MYDTPVRAKIKAIFELNQHFDLGLTKRQLFDFADVPEATGQSILKSATIRTTSQSGRPPLLQNNEDGTGRIVHLLETEGFEAARMTWAGMASEAGVSVEVSSKTVQRHMNQEGFFKRKACQRQPVSLPLGLGITLPLLPTLCRSI